MRALAELDKVSKSEVFLKSAGAPCSTWARACAAVVSDPGATAKGVGEGVKRFGTNLGRKAKRAGDEAVDEVKDEDKQKEGAESRRPARPPRPASAAPTRCWA